MRDGYDEKGRRRPKPAKIKVTAEDRERLAGLASAAMDRMPDLAGYLSDELDRAQLVRAGRSAVGFVRMGSEVEFRDDTTGKVQVVSLVYPAEADIGLGRISVLTPSARPCSA